MYAETGNTYTKPKKIGTESCGWVTAKRTSLYKSLQTSLFWLSEFIAFCLFSRCTFICGLNRIAFTLSNGKICLRIWLFDCMLPKRFEIKLNLNYHKYFSIQLIEWLRFFCSFRNRMAFCWGECLSNIFWIGENCNIHGIKL